MLNEKQKKLFSIPSSIPKEIVISRFDAFLNEKEKNFKIIENNTDCPAGVLFTGRIMKIIEKVTILQDVIKEYSVNQDPIMYDFTFLRHLLNAYEEFDSKKIPNIAILQIKDKYSPETYAIKDAFKRIGINARIVDPRTLSYRDGILYDDNFVIHLIWNKINTVYFDPILEECQDELAPFLQALYDGSVCHLNSFAARYITESKLCHAFLWEAQDYFSKEEQDFIREVIPWSVKMQPGTVYYREEKRDLIEIALKYRTDLVLKAAYDIRGEGVVIGRSCSPQEWEYHIQSSLGNPFILQEYIMPPELPVMVSPLSPPKYKKFSVDMFMFNGKLQGFGSKVSDNIKLNIFQGGSKNAIFFTLKGQRKH